MKHSTLLIFLLAFVVGHSQPANDNPCGATNLPIGTNSSASWSTGTNINATDSYVPLINCDGLSNGDIWFYFNAPSSGSVTIETDYYSGSPVVDLGLAVYRASNCSSLNNAFNCNDHCLGNSVNPPNWLPCLSLSNLTNNEKIYIRLWEFNNNMFGQFRIRVYNNTVATSTANISVTPNPVPFGNVQTGTSSTKTITINNSGTSTLNVSNISASSSVFSVQPSSINVSSNSSQTINVTFTPSSATSYNGTITFNSNATQGTVSISATGTGTSAPQPTISVLPSQIDFGSISVSSGAITRDFTIKNNGNLTLNISSILVPNPVYSLTGPTSIAPYGSSTVQVSFNPTSASSYNGNITINSNATNVSGGTVTIPVTGAGLAVQINDIVGFVKDLSVNTQSSQLIETPLQGATVKLKNASNQILQTVIANSAGQYTFSGYTGTNYTVEASNGQFTVTKTGYNYSNPALTFVLPQTITYQITQQTTSLQNRSITLTKDTPSYSITGAGYSTSGYQNITNQCYSFAHQDYPKIKEALGRLYAVNQQINGGYINVSLIADKSSQCTYAIASMGFSAIYSTAKAKLISNSIIVKTISDFINSKAVKMLKDGFNLYITIYPNSEVAMGLSDMQAIMDNQILRINGQPTVFFDLDDPMNIVYKLSAQSMVKFPYRNRTQPKLTTAYSDLSTFSTLHFTNLNSIVNSSKSDYLHAQVQRIYPTMAHMDEQMIYADALDQISNSFDKASAVSTATGLVPLSVILTGLSNLLVGTKVVLLSDCVANGFITNRFEGSGVNDGIMLASLKTDTINPIITADLATALNNYNNVIDEIKDDFDYSHDAVGLSKMDTFIKVTNELELRVDDAMSALMANVPLADSTLPNFFQNYSEQLVTNVQDARMKAIALQMLYLSKALDTTDATLSDTIVLTTQAVKNANNLMTISIGQFQNLVSSISASPYVAMQKQTLVQSMQSGASQTVSVTVKNYGNQLADNCYLLVHYDGPFTVSIDSIYIGRLNPSEEKTVAYNLLAPTGDTIVQYQYSIYGNSSIPFQYGGAVETGRKTTTAIQQNNSLHTFKVYPNPATDIVTIEKMQPLNLAMQLSILDITGKVVLEKMYLPNSNAIEKVSISSLPAGEYTFVITTDFSNHFFKIIKQ